MKNTIFGFYKTKHFIKRQAERNICDDILKLAVINLNNNTEKTTVIISKKLLNKINYNVKNDIFIVIKECALITCFYQNLNNYINVDKETSFKIIT